MREENEKKRRQEEEKRKDEYLEAVKNALFAMMELERILGLYWEWLEWYQNVVWDVWDCPDYLNDSSYDSNEYF